MKRTTDYASKPYNRCLQCHLRMEKKCDGARTSAMKLDRWCEFMRDMKTVNGLTNVDIAEKSGVSLKTIEKLMAQNCSQDIMRETARLIEEAILGSGNQYPCYLAFEETHSAETAAKTDATKAECQAIRDEAQRKIDYLMQQLEYYRRENENLWAESVRKSKIIDRFLERDTFSTTER
jgi:hypothetical protein